MYNSIHNTVIIGKKVIYLPSCHSTNDIAAEIVQAGLFDEGTVVITDHQVNGRGQRGASWNAAPGENLTFSVILSPTFLTVANQFVLSQAVGLSVCAYYKQYIGDVRVKWPNDVYINKKKAVGILIENSVKGQSLNHSILGIGLNINQERFPDARATSLFLETGRKFNLQEEFVKIGQLIDRYYITIQSTSAIPDLQAEYLDNLHGYGVANKFLINGTMHDGIVTGVTQAGKMMVELTDTSETREFGLKEIQWVWD